VSLRAVEIAARTTPRRSALSGQGRPAGQPGADEGGTAPRAA